MDIEPLWALGGWFLFPDCMATPKSRAPVSATCSISPLHFLLFFALLFFLLLLPSNPTTPMNPSTKGSSITVKRFLLETLESASTTTSNMNLHPGQAHSARRSSSPSSSSKRREFGVEAHEVPSGPNPISN
ncbi:hypothetical protein K2173_012838 [Erythroxylum novogranatense]|uniref:CLAVATA3/ESR (CLE)-related protein 44 n=1 Tax=Erythroxylum novogranatense TaxID=1862640 RepID=A0AAV8U9T3_9ROSI|nr:hypothetical protein K2173_012838 [Erythroxylum novogranatense]